MEPTEAQMMQMKKMLDDKLNDWQHEPADDQEQTDPDFKGCYHEYYGVSPSNFY